MALPFTYLIGWKEQDRWYYGVRYARGCHPNDLWTKYFLNNYHHSEETRKRMSANRKGKTSHSGENNPMYGKKQPTETCEYCFLVCSKTNYIRFHGTNCKKVRIL